MRDSQIIISDMMGVMDAALEDFNKAMPSIERNIFNRLQPILKDLEISGGKLKRSIANIKKLNEIRAEIQDAVISPKYKESIKNFTDSLTAVSVLQNEYFATISVDFTPKKVYEALRIQTIDETVINLTESGIQSGVSDVMKDILKQNVMGTADYGDMMEQVRETLLGIDGGEGALTRYTKQVTTDTLNQYSAQYNQMITDDLNLKWHQYIGSLKPKSREFCKLMVKKRYVHDSELPEIIKGKIDGEKVWINPKTDIWAGGIRGTTVQTFATNRGGWMCGHQWIAVSEILVPKSIRKEVYTKIGDKDKLKELN